jgi:nicotinamide mononucleotide transporter
MSQLEIWANIFNLMAVYLAAKNHLSTWPIGIVGCVLYGVLFFDAKLYADVTLQVFYTVTALYGWWAWSSGGENKTELPVTRSTKKSLLTQSAFGLLGGLAYGYFLKLSTDASYPYVDSLILTFSIVGQLLMTKRKIECWPVWILVNTLSIPLFIVKGLNLTAAVYGLFWINALWGHFQWKKGFPSL